MVIALVGLALAMVAGGVWALVEGYDIIVLERGWALVIAGATTASLGLVLLGIAAAVARLGGIRRELAGLRERMARPEPVFPEPPARVDPVAAVSSGLLAGGATDPGPLMPPPPAPAAAPMSAGAMAAGAAAAVAAGAAVSAGLAVMRGRGEASDDLQAAPGAALGDGGALRSLEAPEPPGGDELLPDRDLGPAAGSAAPVTWPAVPGTAEGAEPPAFPSGPPGAPAGAAPLPGPLPEPAPAEAVPLAASGPAGPDAGAPAAENPAVLGTYNSGGNRYVMFADGSIEAETPDGTFRFGSLDELKAFIAAGGERPREG